MKIIFMHSKGRTWGPELDFFLFRVFAQTLHFLRLIEPNYDNNKTHSVKGLKFILQRPVACRVQILHLSYNNL